MVISERVKIDKRRRHIGVRNSLQRRLTATGTHRDGLRPIRFTDPSLTPMHSIRLALIATLLASTLAPHHALAQPAKGSTPVVTPSAPTAVSLGAIPQVKGHTEEGAPLDLLALRGKVVMVYAWSSKCPVCMENMSELRQNYLGWKGQPFELISINTDAKPVDLDQWLALRRITIPVAQRWPSLWAGTPGFSTTLPLGGQQPGIWVLDKTGAVRFQVRGRLTADVWNEVADLL
jgi:AhpC/TSA family